MMEFRKGAMVMGNTKAQLLMGKEKVLEFLYGNVVINMKAILKMIILQEKEYIIIIVEVDMKVILKI